MTSADDGYCTCDGDDPRINASCGIAAHRADARKVLASADTQELINDDAFVRLDDLARECYRIAADHGFHDKPNPIPQSLCLIHSEISEALEAYRDDDIALRFTDNDKPEGLIVELADALIRILDTSHEIAPGEISRALAAKMAYNETRQRGHRRVRL